jgi:hypothetical protein
LLKSDGKIWVLDNGQDHYTFSETDTDGMVVHRRGGVQYGLGVSSMFVASEDDPKEMRTRWNTMIADGYKRNKMTEQDYGYIEVWDDLTFNDRSESSISGHKRAVLFFKNGYGISVLQGGLPIPNTWEVAVLKGVDAEWNICYTTPITSDVVVCDGPVMVEDIMKQIQELENVA